jgi:hypothetical protein
MTNLLIYFFSLFLIASIFMASKPDTQESKKLESKKEEQAEMQVVQLSKGDTTGFARMRETFTERNTGYDMHFISNANKIAANQSNRLVFIQGGEGIAQVTGEDTSSFTVGDIIHLAPSISLEADQSFDALVFTVPQPLPENIPSYIRPDWDPNITDVPGGCATENNAYRRILLTWLDKVGPYQYHALNAHRVRIMDSFTHYHPKEGGFDEFYLVQMVMPGARLYTSDKVETIKDPSSVDANETDTLLKETKLNVGDLVYLPRGIAHRGYGGVLAHVITVPGFVPGSEIGLDHHLRAINEKLSLNGKDAIPYNEFASTHAVVK